MRERKKKKKEKVVSPGLEEVKSACSMDEQVDNDHVNGQKVKKTVSPCKISNNEQVDNSVMFVSDVHGAKRKKKKMKMHTNDSLNLEEERLGGVNVHGLEDVKEKTEKKRRKFDAIELDKMISCNERSRDTEKLTELNPMSCQDDENMTTNDNNSSAPNMQSRRAVDPNGGMSLEDVLSKYTYRGDGTLNFPGRKISSSLQFSKLINSGQRSEDTKTKMSKKAESSCKQVKNDRTPLPAVIQRNPEDQVLEMGYASSNQNIGNDTTQTEVHTHDWNVSPYFNASIGQQEAVKLKLLKPCARFRTTV